METQSINDLVAEEIRALLARRRMSASDLARHTGMTQRAISRRLTGEKIIDVDDLQRIADVLGVDITDLLPRPNEGRTVVTAGQPGRITAYATGGSTTRNQINDRKATMTAQTGPIGRPNNFIPKQATRRPARLPLALTGS